MREQLLGACETIGLDDEERGLLAAFLERLDADPSLADRFASAVEAMRVDPVALIGEFLESRLVERQLGRAEAWIFYFALSLSQVERAARRRAARGITKPMDQLTLADMAMRVRLNRAKTGIFGITIETLEWFQEYLSGELVRIGAMQFKLIPFPREVRLFEDSRLVLGPGIPVIKMHLPNDADLHPGGIRDSIASAWKFFGSDSPAGVYGEAWFLDPGLSESIRNPELRFLIELGPHFPSLLTELNTLKRLFHYDADRSSLLGGSESGCSSLQLRILQRLKTPGDSLQAAGVFGSAKRLRELGCA